MQAGLDLATIDGLTDGRLGTCDVACPLCGPDRRAVANQRRRVLRVWRLDPGFATFHCARCGEHGFVRDDKANADVRIAPETFRRVRVEAAQRERAAAQQRATRARWLWQRRQPIAGSAVEVYLRETRAYSGPIPETLGFLAERDDHAPAMIAAFGIPGEPEPGMLAVDDTAVAAVHITRLAPDGAGKAGTAADKIMIGKSVGSPIVLAPANDLLGLAITEGIEDALSVHLATGLGAWAAGSASRMPALAANVPAYVASVTVLADDDAAGCRYAGELGEQLRRRHCHVRTPRVAASREAAA